MRQAGLIGHVIEVYTAFRNDPGIPADAFIRKFFYERKYLGSKDRRFVGDAYFGVIKHYRRLDWIARDAFESSSIDPAQMVAAYCIAFLAISPEEMLQVLNEIQPRHTYQSEAFWRMADRSREIERLSALAPDERLAIAYSFPDWFVRRVREEYGDSQVEAILNSLNDEAPISLRANTLVTDRTSLQAELAAEGCETSFSNIAENALTLPKRVNLFGSNAFRRGAFEIQDEASQLVAPLAHIQKTAIRVLDACAGAGGKTLHLAALLKNRGEIYATDADPWKLEELKKRTRRSGAQNVRIIKPNERADRLGAAKQSWFDLVLLDVPCTGTGTLRRNPGIKWTLTEQMLSELTQKQRLIIEENIGYVKPGATLLYATCSLLKEEGEDQVEWLTQNHPEFTLEETLRTRPDQQGCDGFFAARLRKVSDKEGVLQKL